MAALLPSCVPLLLCSAAYYAAFRSGKLVSKKDGDQTTYPGLWSYPELCSVGKTAELPEAAVRALLAVAYSGQTIFGLGQSHVGSQAAAMKNQKLFLGEIP
jgi:hypothetical protein